MASTLTLGIVKPDAVASGKTGAIMAHLQKAGFSIRAARLVRLTRAQAAAFYAARRATLAIPRAVEREEG